MIFLLILYAVETVTSPTAPWWAGPAYVQSIERIVITFITISVPTVVTAGVQVYYARRAAKDRAAKRAESRSEHQGGLNDARTERAVLAAKVEAAALHMADTVARTKHETLAAIEQNTALTINAADASKEAAAVANHVNEKIEQTNERLLDAINAGRGKRPEELPT